MTLFHTALFAEAKPLVEHFSLTCTQTKPYKIYKNESIVLCVLGMGAKNTFHVKELFALYPIQKAINIGIAGCKKRDIKIGTLFCTSHKLQDVPHETLTSVHEPLSDASMLETTLVDMEAQAFVFTCREFLDIKDIYILKIVSDHLDTNIPKKEFVWKIIEQNLKSISKILTLPN